MYEAIYSITEDIINVSMNITIGVIGIFLIYTFLSWILFSVIIKNIALNPYIGRYGPCRKPLFSKQLNA